MRPHVPQTRHSRAVVAAGAVVLSLLVGCSPGGGKKSQAPAPFVVAGDLPAARLAPVLVVKSRSPVRVPVAFTNPTKDDLTYAVDADGTGLYQLQGSLHRDGQLVEEEGITYGRLPFKMNQVRRLKPGAAVVLDYEYEFTARGCAFRPGMVICDAWTCRS